MLTGDNVVSDPPLADEEVALDVYEELPTLDEIEDRAFEVEVAYTPSDEDCASTPLDVDNESGIEVWERLPMDEIDDAGEELLKDPDGLFAVAVVVR